MRSPLQLTSLPTNDRGAVRGYSNKNTTSLARLGTSPSSLLEDGFQNVQVYLRAWQISHSPGFLQLLRGALLIFMTPATKTENPLNTQQTQDGTNIFRTIESFLGGTRGEHEDPGPTPDGGKAAWLQVACAHVTIFNTWGFLNSFGSVSFSFYRLLS